mgnify:CR=1 FL=1
MILFVINIWHPNILVNKYISATISTHLVYDDDIDIGIDTYYDGDNDTFGPITQFKEVFALDFHINFKFAAKIINQLL